MTAWRPSLVRGPGAQALFLPAQFGGQRLAKILRGKHLADFDLGAAVEWRALHPVDRLIQRFGLDQPETADEVAGVIERAATDRAFSAGIFQPGALRCRVQSLACL